MNTINRSALVPYSAEQMFMLVNDIRSYPEFLPWCSASEVLSESPDEVRASLTLSWSGMEKSFTTHNLLQTNKMIEVRLVEGPLKHLEGFWRFEHLDNQVCKVLLDLEFAVGGGIMNFALGAVFHQIANTLVDAFCERAKVIYGQANN